MPQAFGGSGYDPVYFDEIIARGLHVALYFAFTLSLSLPFQFY